MNREALHALTQIAELARQRAGTRIPVVGVAGSQGSGKTTLVSAYADAHPGAAHFSLDDVYLPKSFRQLIAQDVHKLFVTRGPPGTHNLMLLDETLDALQEADAGTETRLPGFDKVTDDPLPDGRRRVFKGRPSLILVEGWCLGATPQDEAALVPPVNGLEAEEDTDGVWRKEVNANLAGAYQETFARLDAILHLRAPSFDVVAGWRCEQGAGLLGRDLTDAERVGVARFVAHFERITRHMLAGGVRADVEALLDVQRNVVSVRGS